MALPRLAEPDPEVRVSHFQSAGLEAALQHIARPEMLAAGQVTVMDFRAVAERFGGRWPLRREHVQHHISTCLDRQLGPTAFHLWISETDVVVCQPDLGALSGQAACLRLLREVFAHFLGTGENAGLSLHQVISVTEDGIEARRVDQGALEAFMASASATPAQTRAILGAVDQWTPFTTLEGLQVTVRPQIEPVVFLRDGRLIGPRLSSVAVEGGSGAELRPHELARLSGGDRLKIDVAGLLGGLELLRAGAGPKPHTVILPVAVSSLATTMGRSRIVAGLREAQNHVATGVICELRGVEGVPSSQLCEAVGVVRPFATFVVAHLAELSIVTTRPLGGLGFSGVSTRAPPGMDGAAMISWASVALRGARRICKAAIFYGLPSEGAGQLAHMLGATHASLAA